MNQNNKKNNNMILKYFRKMNNRYKIIIIMKKNLLLKWKKIYQIYSPNLNNRSTQIFFKIHKYHPSIKLKLKKIKKNNKIQNLEKYTFKNKKFI